MQKKKKQDFYRTARLPRPIFDQLAYARMKLLEKGEKLEELREIVRPERCPICGGPLRIIGVKAEVEYVECEKCHYKQPRLLIDVKGSDLYEFLKALGIGVLVGFGLAALLYLIFGGRKK